MTWYLYRRPDGNPELTERPLILSIYPGYTLVRECAEKPLITGMKLATDGQLQRDLTAAWQAVRNRRAALLIASDWTQLADAPLTLLQKAAWTRYRQSLRDVTEQSDPAAIVWPTQPKAQP